MESSEKSLEERGKWTGDKMSPVENDGSGWQVKKGGGIAKSARE